MRHDKGELIRVFSSGSGSRIFLDLLSLGSQAESKPRGVVFKWINFIIIQSSQTFHGQMCGKKITCQKSTMTTSQRSKGEYVKKRGFRPNQFVYSHICQTILRLCLHKSFFLSQLLNCICASPLSFLRSDEFIAQNTTNR